jgi:hypothetical protein
MLSLYHPWMIWTPVASEQWKKKKPAGAEEEASPVMVYQSFL